MNAASLVRPFTALPNVRGKVRILRYLLMPALRARRNYVIDAELIRPVPYSVRLDLKCAHELMAFLMSGYESDLTRFLAHLYKGRAPFFDVGANIGLISIPFLKLIAKRKLDVFEPRAVLFEAVSSNATALRHNLMLNGLGSHVMVHEVGLGEGDANVEIQVERNLKEGEGTGTANILPASSTFECERIPLAIRALDNLVEQGLVPEQCEVMKLDTDGYDLFVLRGARQMLLRSRPVVFGEFNAHCMSWHSQTLGDVQREASNLGYVTHTRIAESWKFTAALDEPAYVSDLLLLPEERIADYGWCLQTR